MSVHSRTLIGVFSLAVVIRLATLAVLLPEMKPDVDPDSYRSLGRNLAVGKGFVAVSLDGRELPNVSRTPVYPLFLASLIRVGGDKLGLFLAAQCVLGALTCLLTALLASRWLSWRAAAVAGMLVALDPNSIQRCVDLRTETLFTLLLVGGACVLAWRSERWWGWLLGGVLWSDAALCRPIAVGLWVVALLLMFVTKARWTWYGAFMIAFLALVGAWAGRNTNLTGRWFVSTIPTYNLLIYRAAGVKAEETHQPLETVQQQLLADCGDIQFFDGRERFASTLRTYRRTAMYILSSAPFLAARQAVVGWMKVLFGPGARGLENELNTTGRSARWWPLLYGVGLAGLTLLAIVGAIRLGRNGLLLVVLSVYFVVLAGGPEANSRFRAPITPMLAILTVASMATLRKKECDTESL